MRAPAGTGCVTTRVAAGCATHDGNELPTGDAPDTHSYSVVGVGTCEIETARPQSTQYTPAMTNKDVLLVRIHEGESGPGSAAAAARSIQDLWELRASGKPVQRIGPFPAALDVALEWAAELDGKIYRQHELGSEPELYRPTA